MSLRPPSSSLISDTSSSSSPSSPAASSPIRSARSCCLRFSSASLASLSCRFRATSALNRSLFARSTGRSASSESDPPPGRRETVDPAGVTNKPGEGGWSASTAGSGVLTRAGRGARRRGSAVMSSSLSSLASCSSPPVAAGADSVFGLVVFSARLGASSAVSEFFWVSSVVEVPSIRRASRPRGRLISSSSSDSSSSSSASSSCVDLSSWLDLLDLSIDLNTACISTEPGAALSSSSSKFSSTAASIALSLERGESCGDPGSDASSPAAAGDNDLVEAMAAFFPGLSSKCEMNAAIMSMSYVLIFKKTFPTSQKCYAICTQE